MVRIMIVCVCEKGRVSVSLRGRIYILLFVHGGKEGVAYQ